MKTLARCLLPTFLVPYRSLQCRKQLQWMDKFITHTTTFVLFNQQLEITRVDTYHITRE